MVHLVYCDNTGKSGERVIDRIIAGKNDGCSWCSRS